MPRDDPPEEMSVEEYLKLTGAKKPKGKKKRKPVIAKPDTKSKPAYCGICGKRVTGNHSTIWIVTDEQGEHGKIALPYHFECYHYGEPDEQAKQR